MNRYSDFLFLIPARGGSKGLPGKNIKPLAGKPLLYYTIEQARKLTSDVQICLSTDSDEIIQSADNIKLSVPFKRPDFLASDTAHSREVILHALDFFFSKGRLFKAVVLLQPTSPFRTADHIREAINLYRDDVDMVVSVKKATSNPFYNLFEEKTGLLKTFMSEDYARRQDAPLLYEFNGAIYVINANSIRKSNFSEMKKIIKYEMSDIHSIDIDTLQDWMWAEFIIEKDVLNND